MLQDEIKQHNECILLIRINTDLDDDTESQRAFLAHIRMDLVST